MNTVNSVCIFLCIFPQTPLGNSQTSTVVTGAHGSGRVVLSHPACCWWFCFPVLAWSMPRPDGVVTVFWRVSSTLRLFAALRDQGPDGRLPWFLVKTERWVGATVALPTAAVSRRWDHLSGGGSRGQMTCRRDGLCLKMWVLLLLRLGEANTSGATCC